MVNNGYIPRSFKVKAGVPVELNLESNGVYSCAAAFTMRQFGVREFLQPTDKRTVAFTPKDKGRFVYSCSMGMYTGVMEVI